MPIFAWECPVCFRTAEVIVPVDARNDAVDCACGAAMTRIPAGANFRLPGGNPKINYADQFTADMLGVPVKDLPPGVKT